MFRQLFVVILLFLVFPSAIKAQVVINEFSSSTSSDWIEIYAFEDIDISGWILRDTASSVMKKIPDSTKVGPSSNPFYYLEVGNRLNKDGDIIRLLKSDDATLVDQIPYGKEGGVCVPSEGQSIGRFPDANPVIERFKSSSKGVSNNTSELDPCPTPTEELVDTPTQSTKPTSIPKLTGTVTSINVPTQIKIPTEKPKEEESVGNDLSSEQDDGTNYDVLGIRQNEGVNDEYLPEIESEKENFPFIAGVFIIIGLGLVSFPIIIFLKQTKKI